MFAILFPFGLIISYQAEVTTAEGVRLVPKRDALLDVSAMNSFQAHDGPLRWVFLSSCECWNYGT